MIPATSSPALATRARMRSQAQARLTAVGRAARMISDFWANWARNLAGSLARMEFAARLKPMAAAQPMAGAPRVARVWMQ